ncbi:MAG: DNA polymerase III subunit delta' [Chloroflexota bacterium]|nr:DNA polymerase III subunit delta' [Chloroflexota bacterium]MDE2942182.1 DNA polymerase III subunit delta' [Chloroflexota bacterium]MDE3267517.1 DNA polymerase III subunit delta' [Chloroflexota bacterium]
MQADCRTMWRIAGHDEAVTLLSRSLEKEKLSHAYLFAGPPRVGKATLAMILAQGVNCLADTGERPCGECSQCLRIAAGQHPDVQVVDLASAQSPTRREIGIDQVREVQRAAALKPFEGRRRVFIFPDAPSLSTEASNALLKLLEEPPDSVLLLLLTTQADAILPTIRSRCQLVELGRLPVEAIAEELTRSRGVAQDEAESLARLSGGSIGWAMEASARPEVLQEYTEELERVAALLGEGLEGRFAWAEETASLYARDRERALLRLRTALGWWRDLLALKEGGDALVSNTPALESMRRHAGWVASSQAVEAVGRIREAISHLEANVNPRLALEVMVLGLPRGAAQAERKAV